MEKQVKKLGYFKSVLHWIVSGRIGIRWYVVRV